MKKRVCYFAVAIAAIGGGLAFGPLGALGFGLLVTIALSALAS